MAGALLALPLVSIFAPFLGYHYIWDPQTLYLSLKPYTPKAYGPEPPLSFLFWGETVTFWDP